MNLEPIYEETAFAHGFAPIARELGEVRVLHHEAAPEPVVVTRGGMDRPDVRALPLTGPQAGWL